MTYEVMSNVLMCIKVNKCELGMWNQRKTLFHMYKINKASRQMIIKCSHKYN